MNDNKTRHIVRHNILFVCLLTLLFVPSAASARTPTDTLFTGAPTDFIENLGQWEDCVLFKSVMQNAVLFAEKDAFTIVVRHEKESRLKGLPHSHHMKDYRYHAYRMTFVGANAACSPKGHDALPTYDNYFTSRDRSKWRGHVKHYERVVYDQLYEGIDLVLYSAENAAKYDFYLHAGTDVSKIKMHYDGTDGIKLQKNGHLLIHTSATDIVEMMPIAYQTADTGRRVVEARYVVDGNNVCIQLGDYDTKLPVVIDPFLYFSTYTGSTADNWGTTATYDSKKNTYTSGLVFDIGYPASLGAYNTNFVGGVDVGIFKFDTSGSQRLYATYLGGTYADMPHSLFVNSFDELVIYGTTGSDNFPVTANAFDTTFNGGMSVYYEAPSINFPNGSDIFVSRFSEDGSRLLASTYVGGSDNDGLNFRQLYNPQRSNYYSYAEWYADYVTLMDGNDSLYYNYGDGARGELIVDDQNNVYVGSTTFSSDFPTTPGCIQDSLHGMQEGVVFKLDYNMRNMIWSTYLGGESDDAVYSIDVDSQYNLLACGGTCSQDFPTTEGAYNTTYNGGTVDGFVCKISYHGDRMMASTFYGSNKYDQSYFVRRGKENDVFIFGQTKANGSTLIHNANYNVPNSGQFIAHLTPNLDSLIWSTKFGTATGKPNISPTAFVADLCNRVYAVGWGRDFVGYYGKEGTMITWRSGGTTGMEVTPDAFQSETDGQDFYIMSMSMDASTLDYATFFGEVNPQPTGSGGGGGDHVDGGTSRFDRLGVLYQSVCGSCGGTQSFPTTANVWSNRNNATNCNNAVFRYQIHSDFPLAEFAPVPVGCAPYNVQFNNTGRGTSFEWDFGDGTTSTERNPTHQYDHGGEYTVKLIAHQLYGCSEIDSTSRIVRVLENNSRRLPPIRSCVEGQTLQIGFAPIQGVDYKWVQGAVSDSTIANPNVNTAGTYILRLTQEILADADGCVEIDTFDVEYYSLLDTLYTYPPVCAYDSFGTATAVLSNSVTGNITYYWDGLASTNATFGPIPNSRQRHHLRVANDFCEVERYFTVYTPEPSLNKSGNVILCDGCDGSINITMSDPRGTEYTYLWNNGATTNSIINLCEGEYIVTVSDSNHCTYRDTTRITQSTTYMRPITIWADDSVVYESHTTGLHVTPIDGCTYQWTPSNNIQNSTSPDATAKVYEPTTYVVTLTDQVGCHHVDSVSVDCRIVDCGKESIFIPNAFTPNGDGRNDRLCIRHSDPVMEFYIAIFTRWGELLYESRDITQCWDGRYNGNECLPDVYYYTCRYTCVEGKRSERKGDITLIR